MALGRHARRRSAISWRRRPDSRSWSKTTCCSFPTACSTVAQHLDFHRGGCTDREFVTPGRGGRLVAGRVSSTMASTTAVVRSLVMSNDSPAPRGRVCPEWQLEYDEFNRFRVVQGAVPARCCPTVSVSAGGTTSSLRFAQTGPVPVASFPGCRARRLHTAEPAATADGFAAENTAGRCWLASAMRQGRWQFSRSHNLRGTTTTDGARQARRVEHPVSAPEPGSSCSTAARPPTTTSKLHTKHAAAPRRPSACVSTTARLVAVSGQGSPPLSVKVNLDWGLPSTVIWASGGGPVEDAKRAAPVVDRIVGIDDGGRQVAVCR